MSCYVVNDETVLVIAKGLIEYGIGTPFAKFTDMQWILVNERVLPIAQALMDMNIKSYNTRYPDTIDKPFAPVSMRAVDYNMAMLVGCIECYEYQSCEADDYEDSLIHIALSSLKDRILHKAVQIATGVNEIPWGYIKEN